MPPSVGEEDLWEESKASCGNLRAEPVLGLRPGVVSSELKVFPLGLRAELIIMGCVLGRCSKF